ncbi:hypothetical protein BGW38_009029 [Lunasporangiospora selenospora]|uniref:Uncharacterized protein n=1 Tax=Lunasporangiospora selenospora TaxID=979761 RepID=A0A9P6KFG2_9FUNG|nr:hypothetical protein BGW38_009029 [Lunasporangiospora selenospora]
MIENVQCMAPDCNAMLSLRTFHMAALGSKEMDPLTNRPLKVLVCKDHVPMPKHSLTSNSLSIKHPTSVPKPAPPGLYRSLMGDRGTRDGGDIDAGAVAERPHSPRSLAEGSHSQILRDMAFVQGDSNNQPTPTSHLSNSNADSLAVSRVENEEALDPTKDDRSFRDLPIRHRDYESNEKDSEVDEIDSVFATKETASASPAFANKLEETLLNRSSSMSAKDEDFEVSLETPEDVAMRMKQTHQSLDMSNEHQVEQAEIKAPHGELEEAKLVDLAFSSKLMQNRHEMNKEEESKTVGEDEWDTTPADDYSRREPIAGL